MFGSPLGSVLFGAATDFADHDNGFGGFIVLKGFQSLLQGRADDRIAARAKACGETDVRQLPHQLIGQRSGLGHQTQRAAGHDAIWNNAEVAALGVLRRWQRQQTRTIRPNDAHALTQGQLDEIRAVRHRNAFGDDDNQFDAGFNGLNDGVLGEARRHEHDACFGSSGFDGFRAVGEHVNGGILAIFGFREGDVQPSLAGVHATDDVGAGLEHAGRVGHTLMPGHALDDDRSAIFNEKRHFSEPPWPRNVRPAVRLPPWSERRAGWRGRLGPKCSDLPPPHCHRIARR